MMGVLHEEEGSRLLSTGFVEAPSAVRSGRAIEFGSRGLQYCRPAKTVDDCGKLELAIQAESSDVGGTRLEPGSRFLFFRGSHC